MKNIPLSILTLFNVETLDYRVDNQAFVVLYPPQYLDRIKAFFDNKMRAFARKTRGKQLGRVLFVKGVGGVPPQYFEHFLSKKAINRSSTFSQSL
jgi:hypothetical protein